LDEVSIADLGATEEIEGAAHRGVDGATTELVDEIEVLNARDAAGIGHGDFAPAAEESDEILVDARAEALDISGVDEELAAVFREAVQGVRGDAERSDGLPAIHGDGPARGETAATEIEHEFILTDSVFELQELALAEDAIRREQARRDDDVTGASVDPLLRVIDIHAPTDLETARPSGQGTASGLIITRAELNDVAARQVILLVEASVPSGIAVRDKVRAEMVTRVGEATTDDLFDLAVVEVNARAESSHGENCT
jgi:hypothetical protein